MSIKKKKRAKSRDEFDELQDRELSTYNFIMSISRRLLGKAMSDSLFFFFSGLIDRDRATRKEDPMIGFRRNHTRERHNHRRTNGSKIIKEISTERGGRDVVDDIEDEKKMKKTNRPRDFSSKMIQPIPCCHVWDLYQSLNHLIKERSWLIKPFMI